MRTKISLIFSLLCLPLAFWACGDDGSSANGDSVAEDSDIMAKTFDDLPVCSGKREGVTAYVKDEKTAYICEDGKWIADEDDPAPNSDSGTGSMSSSSSSQVKSSSSEKSSSSSVKSSSSQGMSSSTAKPSSSAKSDSSIKDGSEYDAVANTLTDKRDGQVYKTVKIGDQVWMAENLNYADSAKTISLKGKSWCYNDVAANCDVTGRLYTWAAAIDSVALAEDADNPQTCGCGNYCKLPEVVQGICPSGWHLPSKAEWQTLITAVGGSSIAGTALKTATGWYSQTGNATDSDAYGFSALPTGYRYEVGGFYNASSDAHFWSASQYEYNSHYAYSVGLYCNYGSAGLDNYNKINGFSVRCLQN